MKPQGANTKRPYTRPLLREMSAKEVVRKISEHSYRTEGPPVRFSDSAAGVVVDEHARLAIDAYEKAGHEVRICNREGRIFYEIGRAMLETPEGMSKLGAEIFRLMQMHEVWRERSIVNLSGERR